MSFYKYFYPDYSYKRVLDIDIKKFYDMGIRYALLDIDNTLVPYTSPEPDEKAIEFLNRLEIFGIRYAFVSNNSMDRINLFNLNIKAPAIAKAKKPLLYGISEIMKQLSADKTNTMLIGDQIFTDIVGGKRVGVPTILVEPIKEVDTAFFKFKRYFEKKVIKSYNKYIHKGIKQK